MIRTFPITKARKGLTTLVNYARRKFDEYESWKETRDILSDKELMAAIKEGEEQIKRGEFVDWEDLKKELKLNI